MRNSAELEFVLTGCPYDNHTAPRTNLHPYWNSFWQGGPYDNHIAPRTNLQVDPRLGAAALRAPKVSKEDSCPQAILKHSSLDYRVRHGLQIEIFRYLQIFQIFISLLQRCFYRWHLKPDCEACFQLENIRKRMHKEICHCGWQVEFQKWKRRWKEF